MTQASTLQIISWNVNGIRSVLKKGFLDFARRQQPDILCLQEVRAEPDEVSLDLAGYEQHWNTPPKRRGYSGTAVFSKIRPLSVRRGMGIPEHDEEGRVIALEFGSFHLVNVYTPNSKRDLSRLPYRQQWDKDFCGYLKRLEKTKPIIFCGDLNVAHQEIDLTHPQANRRNHGFTDEERAGFDRFVQDGFVDAFRAFHADGGHYTWWSQLSRCRARNIGWRIDYFCFSKILRDRLVDAYHLPDVMGSDHCPVVLVVRDDVSKRA